jgi:hypothetical protein
MIYCGLSSVNINRETVNAPIQNKVINLVESRIANGQPISGTEVVKTLVDSGIMQRDGKLVQMSIPSGQDRNSETIEKYPAQVLIQLNHYFAIHYGATKPIFDIRGYINRGQVFNQPSKRGMAILPSHTYYISVDEGQMNSMQRLTTPVVLDDYTADQFKALTANAKFTSSYIKYAQVINPMLAATAAPIVQAEMIKSDAIKNATNSQLSRMNGEESRPLNYAMENTAPTMENFMNQLERLKKAFLEAGIDVTVELDADLDIKGRAVNMPDGTKKVILNPLKITEDTAIHEFGHFLVEMLDGDPILDRAYEELKNTELAKAVREAYPEYSEEDYRRELITTAIGLTGAKIERNKPNLFQRIYNRIIRALSKMLGMGDSMSAVDKLARTILDNKIKTMNYEGTLRFFEMDSRETRKKESFDTLVADIRIKLMESMSRLRTQQATEEENLQNEKAAIRLEELGKALEDVKDIESLSKFTSYISSIANKAEEIISQVDLNYDEQNNSTAQNLELLKKMHTIYMYISDFYGGMNPKDSLAQRISNHIQEKIKVLNRKVKPEDRATNKQYQEITAMEDTLDKAITKMGKVYNDYRDTIIPIHVDVIQNRDEFNEINGQINSVIENIKNNKRLIALKKDEEYNTITEEYNKAKKEATTKAEKDRLDAEYKEDLLELNVQQMENKKIGRETLIKELREQALDKSKFSYMMDPLVYSSEVGIQMFALTVKNKMLQANDDTVDTIYKMQAAFKKYKESKGSELDINRFNEDIIEVVEYEVADTSSKEVGKKKKMNLLAFVQKYDVNKYYKEIEEFEKSLNAKYKIPDDKEGRSAWFSDETNKKNKAAFYRELNNWYKDNGKLNKDAIDSLNRLEADKKAREKALRQAESDQNSDLMAKLYADIKDIDTLIKRYKIYTGNNEEAYVYTKFMYEPSDRFINPKYTALENNKPAFEYYTALLKQFQEDQSVVGTHRVIKNHWDKYSYVAPAILSDGLEKMQRNGAISAVQMGLKDKFNFLETDINYGDSINANKENKNKLVPIFYITPTDEKLVTRDMISAIIQFNGMANMYKRKSEIAGAVMAMSHIIETRTVPIVDAANNPIINRFGKMMGLTRHETKSEKSNTYKHLEEWISSIFFGETDMKTAISIRGNQISTAKLVNTLNSYTALNSLAFNFLQAGNQFILDNFRVFEEGVASQFYDKKNLGWAKATYYSSITDQTGDALKFAPTSKISQAIVMFDALGENITMARDVRTGPKALRMASGLPMAIQSGIENETAVTRMLAVLDSFKGNLKDKDGNVIKNEKGEDANVYDLLILNKETGRYEIDSRVENAEALKLKIRNRLSGLTKKSNQVKTKFDDAMIQRREYGKMIMLFRRYFVPSLRKHWGHGDVSSFGGGLRRDIELNTISEGMLHSFGRYLRDIKANNGNITTVWAMMEPFERENVKRVFVNLGFIAIALFLSYAVFSDDDDEEQGYASQFLGYQTKRFVTELTQFVNPIELSRTLFSPMAAVRTYQNGLDLIQHIIFQEIPYGLWGDTEGLYYERKVGSHAKGDSKFMAKLEKLFPIASGLEKSSTPEEAAKWFNLGPTAFK